MRARNFLWLLCLVCVLLAGCAKSEQPEVLGNTGQTEEVSLTVDWEKQTISDGQYTYTYSISSDRVSITYPNGATYYESVGGTGGTSGWSDDYDSVTYVSGDKLVKRLEGQTTLPENKKSVLPALLVILLGIFPMVFPRNAWYLSWGWRFRDAEPSALALAAERICGILTVIVGVVLLFR